MNIKYSKDEDILLLEISDERIDYAEEDGPIIIHYSEGNKPVLIEILEASKVLYSAIEPKVKINKNTMLTK
jgi:uncharacterized protein YuzE